MDRLSTLAALVAAAIVTTALMFLTALIVWILGPAAIYFVWIVCIPLELVLLVLDLVLLIVTVSTGCHLLSLWRADEEDRLRVQKERREIDLKIRRLQLIEHQYRINKLRVAARRYQLMRRRLDKRPPANDG